MEAWKLIEKVEAPVTLRELQVVLEFCQQVTDWESWGAGEDVRLLVLGFQIQLPLMSVVKGKIVWDKQMAEVYRLFRRVVVMNIRSFKGYKGQ